MGDLGGYLGLFLGWSLYSLLAEVDFYLLFIPLTFLSLIGSSLSESLGSKDGCEKGRQMTNLKLVLTIDNLQGEGGSQIYEISVGCQKKITSRIKLQITFGGTGTYPH